MAFNGSGTYTLPGAALTTGATVSSTENNTFRNDVATAFNKTSTRDGQTVPTANLPMGGFKHTGLAAGTTAGDSVRFEQLPSASNLLPVASGGTGATDAATARTNLGLVAIASSGSASDLSTGTVATARLASGTANSTTYLRGDQTWATVSSGGVTSFIGQTGAVDPTVFGAVGGLVRAYYIVSSPTANSANSNIITINYAAGTTVSGGSLAYNVYPVANGSNGTWYASEGMYLGGYFSLSGSQSIPFPPNGSRPSSAYSYITTPLYNVNGYTAQAATFLTYSTLTGSYRSISPFSNSNQFVGGCSNQFFPSWAPALWVRYA
jgi:hypothetical protein